MTKPNQKKPAPSPRRIKHCQRPLLRRDLTESEIWELYQMCESWAKRWHNPVVFSSSDVEEIAAQGFEDFMVRLSADPNNPEDVAINWKQGYRAFQQAAHYLGLRIRTIAKNLRQSAKWKSTVFLEDVGGAEMFYNSQDELNELYEQETEDFEFDWEGCSRADEYKNEVEDEEEYCFANDRVKPQHSCLNFTQSHAACKRNEE